MAPNLPKRALLIRLTCFDDSPALPASQPTTVRACLAGTVSNRGCAVTTAATSAFVMPTSSSITHGALDFPPPPPPSLLLLLPLLVVVLLSAEFCWRCAGMVRWSVLSLLLGKSHTRWCCLAGQSLKDKAQR